MYMIDNGFVQEIRKIEDFLKRKFHCDRILILRIEFDYFLEEINFIIKIEKTLELPGDEYIIDTIYKYYEVKFKRYLVFDGVREIPEGVAHNGEN